MDAIDRAYDEEHAFIARCSDVNALLDRMADYRADGRVAEEKGLTKARLRVNDLLELAEDRIAELKAARARPTARPTGGGEGRGRAEDELAAMRAELEASRARQRQAESARAAAEERAARQEKAAAEERAASEARRAARVAERRRAEAEAVERAAREARADRARREAEAAEIARRAAARDRVAAQALLAERNRVQESERRWQAESGSVQAGALQAAIERTAIGPVVDGTDGGLGAPELTGPTMPTSAPTGAPSTSGDVASGKRPERGPRSESIGPPRSIAASAVLPAQGPPDETGAGLVKLRADAGMTQREAATRFGVGPSTIARAELAPTKPLVGDLLAAVRRFRGG